MRCIIRLPDGEKLSVNLNRQDKILVVKEQISTLVSAEPKSLRLIHLGKFLEDTRTLYDYSVKDNANLQVYIKPEDTEPEVEKEASDSSESSKIEETTQTKVEERSTLTNGTSQITTGIKIVESTQIILKETSSLAIGTSQDKVENEHLTIDADLQAAIEKIQEADEICKKCKNNDQKDCKECGCYECGKKDNESEMLICDECQYYFHMGCLAEPLTKIPVGEWYCPGCYTDPNQVVAHGDVSKIKQKKEIKRKWDNGYACAGVETKCTIVKPEHKGPIPGVPVGSSWLYRVHCAQSGVHRPPVAGIAGGAKLGAVSIVLAGGYEDDIDFGESFYYTGSGGRDLSGNKRVSCQSFDQELTRSNLAIAVTMKEEINTVEGAISKNWKKSDPIRVCRSYKMMKEYPEFAPAEGVRYDGIYKLARYWPEVGKEGFIVWRYEFKRDDDEPTPWTEEGKKRIAELGLSLYVPDGYVPPNTKTDTSKKTKSGKKTKKSEENIIKIEDLFISHKKSAPAGYIIPDNIVELINSDVANSRIWDKIIEQKHTTFKDFLETVFSVEFQCLICQDRIEEPTTTICGHNACLGCLKSSLTSWGNSCPLCRAVLYPEAEEYKGEEKVVQLDLIANKLKINQDLVNILKALIPTYN